MSQFDITENNININ